MIPRQVHSLGGIELPAGLEARGDQNKWNAKLAGRRAGSENRNRYGYRRRTIALFDRNHYEHVLAWIYMRGHPIPEQIDHADRDGFNNRWANLRASDATGNSQNTSLSSSNTSGVSGVNWDKKNRKWRARCKISGKYHHVGRFDRIEHAAEALRAFREQHGITEGHGSPRPY